MQLSAAKDKAEGLRAVTGDMVSSSDLADLTRSAEAVEDRSKELASKQAETLEQVSEELLCSPEIIRQVFCLKLASCCSGRCVAQLATFKGKICTAGRQVSVWHLMWVSLPYGCLEVWRVHVSLWNPLQSSHLPPFLQAIPLDSLTCLPFSNIEVSVRLLTDLGLGLAA